MKRKTVICVLILLMLCSCRQGQIPTTVIYENSAVAKQENRYLILYSKTLVSNDSVGSEWITSVKYEDGDMVSNKEFIFDGERLEILLYAVEKDDKQDDVGEKIITFSKLEIGEEETITELLEVVENGGAYKGNTAVWKFTVTLKRLS